MGVQIVTGLFISFHYSSDINEAYYSVFFLIREIYYGWSLRFLHFHSSNNPSRLITNNRISFFPFIFIEDLVFVSGILYLYFLQTHLGISSLSHPDNALEACSLLT